MYGAVRRPIGQLNGAKRNVVDSRWIFKVKMRGNGDKKFKRRLVIRGFKDKNVYDLRETYVPVSALTIVRAFLVIADKYNWELYQ